MSLSTTIPANLWSRLAERADCRHWVERGRLASFEAHPVVRLFRPSHPKLPCLDATFLSQYSRIPGSCDLGNPGREKHPALHRGQEAGRRRHGSRLRSRRQPAGPPCGLEIPLRATSSRIPTRWNASSRKRGPRPRSTIPTSAPSTLLKSATASTSSPWSCWKARASSDKIDGHPAAAGQDSRYRHPDHGCARCRPHTKASSTAT